MSVSDATRAPALRSSTHRLLVTEKDASELYRPVGFLEADVAGESTTYLFAYLSAAVHRGDFRPLLGFADPARAYRSEGLFPLFAERIMDPRRPEHPVFLAALDLSEDASPLEVLSRSGGQRAGDGIMLLPVPVVADTGATSCTFLVNGVRHVEGAEDRIGRLQVGDALSLAPDLNNAVNARALLVTEGRGERLGWVPDALLDYVHLVRERRVTVVRVNGPEVGTRLRLLVRLDGVADPLVQPFTGPAWQTVA